MPALPLVVKAAVDVAHHVLDGAHSDLGRLVLGVAGQGHDAVHVDAGVAVEQAPDDARQVEHERLDQQHDRHPLVVGQLVLLAGLDVLRNDELYRVVVRVRDPADVVRVVHMGARELRRAPAPDGGNEREHRSRGVVKNNGKEFGEGGGGGGGGLFDYLKEGQVEWQ